MKRSMDEMLRGDGTEADLHANTAERTQPPASRLSSSDPKVDLLGRATTSGGSAARNAAIMATSSSSGCAESSSAAQRRKIEFAGTARSSPPGESSTGHSFHLAEAPSSALLSVGCETHILKAIQADFDSVVLPVTDRAAARDQPPDPHKKKGKGDALGAASIDVDLSAGQAVAALPAAISVEREAKVQLILEELVCDVCLELLVDPAAATPCQHIFCWSCLKVWMQDSAKCPTCAGTITQANLSHKIGKLAELAASLLPPDRIRPAEELSKARVALDNHKSCWGTAVIRPSAALRDGPYTEFQYWPCLACRPGNRSGFQCTHRIPEPVPYVPQPPRGATWPMIEDGHDDGIHNVDYHDACSGCTAWVPSKVDDHILHRCFACMEVSCQSFDVEGQCPKGYSLSKLDSNSVEFSNRERPLFKSLVLAGMNEIEKERFIRYIDDNNCSLATIAAGIARLAKQSHNAKIAQLHTAAAIGLISGSASAASTSRTGSSSSHAISQASSSVPTTASTSSSLDDVQDELMQLAMRQESARIHARPETLIARHDAAGSAVGGVMGNPTGNAGVNDPVVPIRIDGAMAEALATKPFCSECTLSILAHFTVWWWMDERIKGVRNGSVTDKIDCRKGIECELQWDRSHAEVQNHICEAGSGSSSSRTGSGDAEAGPSTSRTSSGAASSLTGTEQQTGSGSVPARQLRPRGLSNRA